MRGVERMENREEEDERRIEYMARMIDCASLYIELARAHLELFRRKSKITDHEYDIVYKLLRKARLILGDVCSTEYDR